MSQIKTNQIQNKGIIIFLFVLCQTVFFSFIQGDISSSFQKEWTVEDAKRVKENLTKAIKELKQPAYFLNQLQRIQENAPAQQQNAYNILSREITYILELQSELEWIRLESLRESVEIQSKNQSFGIIKAKALLKQIESLTQHTWEGLYNYNPETIQKAEQLLALRRELVLLNPQIDFDKILTVKYAYPEIAPFIMAQHLGVQPNNWANQTSTRRNGFQAELVELSGIQTGKIQQKTIFTPPVNGAAFTDLKLHWDANRLLFTSLDVNRKWQVYEIDIQGSNLKKVINTVEPDLEFFDATYLPDGRIMAVCNLGYHGVPCVNGSDEVGNMILYNPEDESIRRITFDQDANWNPTILPNGKVMYTRWEYTDLTHYFSRMVMHVNPDGTEQKSLYGSGSMFPNSIFDMQPLPGQTNRFVGIISGHHGVARSGRLIIFDPAKSRKEEKGMIQEIPFRGRPIIPEIKDELVDGVWPQFIKPYPISDDYFLVTAKLSPYSRWGIYLVDTFDNLTLIANAGDSGLIYSIPVKKQRMPPAIPDKIHPEEKEATVFIQDIYEGEGLPGVPRGEVKSIRVFAYEYAYQKTLSDHYNHGIQAGWDIKRLLGTVPVEEDGSAIFKIPANTPISLQPLDSEGRAIQWMRSWLTGMPGEIVSCIGCHEDQNQIPIPKRVLASTRPPHQLQIADGGIRSYTFKYEIEPMLDRACLSCHTSDINPGLPDFKDKSLVEITGWSGTRLFPKNYLAFHPYVNRQGPEADMKVMTPYEYHASTSEVVRILKRGHHQVKLTDEEWNKLYTWIDLNAPGRGWFDADSIKGYDQYQRRIELADKYSGGGIDWRKELAEYAAQLEKRNR
ncbi:MAG: formylglycine-generating enzyme family protein [Tannerellaceae bacterium]|nr:formylglycine-generating enzyme family protein [Tannerellaceae bacterium]